MLSKDVIIEPSPLLLPKDKFIELLNNTLDEIDKIDKKTPWQNTEPKWWLRMMKLRKVVQDINTHY